MPDAVLLGAVALASRRGARGRRRAAGDRAVRRPGRDRAPADRPPAHTAARLGRAGRVEGVGGLWLSVELNVPPGAAIAVLAGAVFAAGGARARAARAPPARRSPRLALVALLAPAAARAAAAAGGKPTSSRRRPRSATGRAQVGGDGVAVHQLLQPNTDPHEYEPRPDDVRGPATRRSCSRTATASTTGWRRSSRRPAATPTVVVLGAARRRSGAGRDERRRGLALRPALVARPAQRDRGRGARSATRSSSADPAHADALPRATRPPTSQARARSTAAIAACIDRVPPAERKLVTDHDAFGYFASALRHPGDRRGDPVADDPGAAVGGRHRRADRPDRARARQGRVPGELDERRSSRETIAQRDGSDARATPSTATRSGRRARSGATYLDMEARQRRRDGRAASAAGSDGCAMTASPDRRPRSSRPATTAGRCSRRHVRLERGERVAVLGPNGGGKTTLFRAAARRAAALAGGSSAAERVGVRRRRPSARASTTRSARSTSR